MTGNALIYVILITIILVLGIFLFIVFRKNTKYEQEKDASEKIVSDMREEMHEKEKELNNLVYERTNMQQNVAALTKQCIQQGESIANLTQQYTEKAHSFEDLEAKIEAEALVEKETQRRRRVTAAMKRSVMERDNCTCQICGISKGFVDSLCNGLGDYLLLEIDHITSVANGGDGQAEDNLQVLCWRCNKKKGSKKTNEQVKETIDYGMFYLKKNVSERFDEVACGGVLDVNEVVDDGDVND